MADAELANNLKKLTKQGKKDHANPNQLYYTHWINCIQDSKTIIRKHGLIPDLRSESELKKMFPPLSAIARHFKARDTTVTKQACNDVIQHFFSSRKEGLLGSASVRTFQRKSFYHRPRSLLIFHKLMHAWALKTLHPKNKDTAFLQGGVYHGCKDKPKENIRDSLYLKLAGSKTSIRQVDKFGDFKLISNSVYLDPSSTAARLFKTKRTHDPDVKQLKRLGKNIRVWKQSNANKPYVKLPDEDIKADDVIQVASEDDKDVPKGFTKRSFKEPMSTLTDALQILNLQLNSEGKGGILENVLTAYNVIQKMTGQGTFFPVDNDDQDGSEVGDEEEDEEEEDDGGEDDDAKDDEEWKYDVENVEEDDDDEKGEDSEEEEESDDGMDEEVREDINANEGGGANVNEQQQEEKNDDNDLGDGKDDVDKEEGRGRKENEGGEENRDGQDDVNVVPTSNEESVDNIEDVLNDLNTYIRGLKKEGVTCGALTGKEIQDVLNLNKTPSLRTANQKKYFYSVKSERWMKHIKRLYKNGNGISSLEIDVKNGWIKELAIRLKSLNWEDSIDGLAEKKTLGDENVLLLWNQSAEFVDEFIHQTDSQITPSQKGKRSDRKRSPTKKTGVQRGEKLTY